MQQWNCPKERICRQPESYASNLKKKKNSELSTAAKNQ